MYHWKTEKKKIAISASFSSFFPYVSHTHTHTFQCLHCSCLFKIEITEINAEILCEITPNIKMWCHKQFCFWELVLCKIKKHLVCFNFFWGLQRIQLFTSRKEISSKTCIRLAMNLFEKYIDFSPLFIIQVKRGPLRLL